MYAGTVHCIETVDKDGDRDKSVPIAGLPGGQCWLNSPPFLELLVESILVVGGDPELMGGLCQQKPVRELITPVPRLGGLDLGDMRGQLHQGQGGPKLLLVESGRHGNLPLVHIHWRRVDTV